MVGPLYRIATDFIMYNPSLEKALQSDFRVSRQTPEEKHNDI
jgi:hypothetical protein